MNRILGVAVSVGFVLVVSVLGFLLGRAEAPDRDDWNRERETAKAKAFDAAHGSALARARTRGVVVGQNQGRAIGQRRGSAHGRSAGEEEASAELVSIEEQEAEEAAELEYTAQLPNGDPGYLLPEEERSLACIGYSAVDGECVGD